MRKNYWDFSTHIFETLHFCLLAGVVCLHAHFLCPEMCVRWHLNMWIHTLLCFVFQKSWPTTLVRSLYSSWNSMSVFSFYTIPQKISFHIVAITCCPMQWKRRLKYFCNYLWIVYVMYLYVTDSYTMKTFIWGIVIWFM